SLHIFAGVNERFALNLAAGLSKSGLVPFYCGPAAHMPVLAEDWKFIALENLPVTVVALAPGSELANWGPGHLAYEDVEAFRCEGSAVYQPATVPDLLAVLEGVGSSRWDHGPVYLRIPEVPSVIAPAEVHDQRETAKRIMADGFYVIDSHLDPDKGRQFT